MDDNEDDRNDESSQDSLPVGSDDETLQVDEPAGESSAATFGGASNRSLGVDGRVGRYRLIKELGRGGQATVYLAIDEELGRQIALKVMPVGMQAPAIIKRFQREAAIVSRLDDPGICSVHDAGIADGSAYIAMRYLRGVSFNHWVKKINEERISQASDSTLKRSRERSVAKNQIHRILVVLEQVARSLQAAHEAGVVHRDIKPANIMMTEDDRPVIVDFGLARANDLQHETLTISGDIFGTPLYMSAEQVRGESLDERTDVYSLGVILYEALSGQRPFNAATREGLYRMILTETATSLRRLNPDLSRDLEVIATTAMEKDLRRRYQSAEALADDIGRVRRHEVIQAKPAPAWFRFWRLCQRNKLAASLISAIFVLLSVSLIILGGQNRELERGRQASEQATYRAQIRAAHAALQNGDAMSLQQTLESVDPARRGWEWRYLTARPTLPLYRTNLALDINRASAVQDDDRLAWLLANKSQFILFDAERGELVRSFVPGQWIESFCPSPDGRSLLISMLNPPRLMLLDGATGKKIWPKPVPGFNKGSACFSPDGREILACHRSGFGSVDRIIDSKTGEDLRLLEGTRGASRDSCHFLSADLIVGFVKRRPTTNSSVFVRHARDGSLVKRFDNLGNVQSIEVDQKNGRVMVTSRTMASEVAAEGQPSPGQYTSVLDLLGGERLMLGVTLPGKSCFVGDHALACSAPGGIEIRDLQSGNLQSRQLRATDMRNRLIAVCGGSRLLETGGQGDLITWKTRITGSPWFAPSVGGWDVALSRGGRHFAWSNWGIIHVRDARDGALLWEHNLPSRELRTLTFSPDGKMLGVGDQVGAIHILDSGDGTPLFQSARISKARMRRQHLTWSHDQKTVYVADSAGGITSWKIGEESPRELIALDRKVDTILVAADDNTLVIGLGPGLKEGHAASSGAVVRIDVETGEIIDRTDREHAVTAIIEASDLPDSGGRMSNGLIVGDKEGRVSLYDRTKLTPIRELGVVSTEILSLVDSGDPPFNRRQRRRHRFYRSPAGEIRIYHHNAASEGAAVHPRIGRARFHDKQRCRWIRHS